MYTVVAIQMVPLVTIVLIVRLDMYTVVAIPMVPLVKIVLIVRLDMYTVVATQMVPLVKIVLIHAYIGIAMYTEDCLPHAFLVDNV